MSTSTPGNALFLTDDPAEGLDEGSDTPTQAASRCSLCTELGAIPEVCAAFELLTYNLEEQAEWEHIRSEYAAGRMMTSEVKRRAIEVTTAFVEMHQDLRSDARKRIDEFLFDPPLPSVDLGRELFLEGSNP